MDGTDELRKLRQQLIAAEERAKEAEQQAKRAERAAADAVLQNLRDFLHGCHHLNNKVKAVTDFSQASSGPTTNPVARWYPQRITEWKDFNLRQQKEWELLDQYKELWTEKLYPSITNLDFIGRRIDPIGSENELRHVQRVTLEDNVRSLFESIHFGPEQSVDGQISFENQARFRTDEGEDLAKRTADMAIRDQYARNIRADQYCVFRRNTGVSRPVVAIEYKAPHKLTIEEISTGLEGEIWPERDVIDKHGETFQFWSKNLLAAVVTQLFSYMIDREVQYGYISTGEAIIFGYIPNDPTSFHYSVNIPRHDYVADHENCLERTAVAQVFAFILQALRAGQPGPEWNERARKTLKRWPVEFHDILATIPITERKSRMASTYQPSVWLSVPKRRRRYKLRSRCDDSSPEQTSEDDDKDGDPADIDTPSRPIATRTRQAKNQGTQSKSRQQQGTHRQYRKKAFVKTMLIEEKPYCSQACLRGLCHGLPVDTSCPNAVEHGQSHLSKRKFLKLLRYQIDTNRGADADCIPLWIYGECGALFKVRLSGYGYTLVAKGMEAVLGTSIKNEYAIYQHLESVQGSIIPVCCGVIELRRPYFFDGVPLEYLLLTSFAGKSLALMINEPESRCVNELDNRKNIAFQIIRSLGVKHGDEADRNVVYNPGSDSLMVIDFGRSAIIRRKPLGQLSPNRKRAAGHLLDTTIEWQKTP